MVERAPVKVLVVDDEPNGRDLLRSHVARRPELRLVGEAEDGPAAVKAARDLRPDLLLLDIQMPGLDGFGVLGELARGREPLPRVVFATAFDQHALRAFEVNALDYLLKPISKARFDEAVDRCLASALPPSATVQHLLQDTFRQPPSRFLVRSTAGIHPVPIAQIEWVEADADYVRLHGAGRVHLLERSMTEMERVLTPLGFIRVHRSAIVRLEAIQHLRAEGSGRYSLRLASGKELVSSRSYAHLFQDWML